MDIRMATDMDMITFTDMLMTTCTAIHLDMITRMAWTMGTNMITLVTM
jgi:hypothetical protein